MLIVGRSSDGNVEAFLESARSPYVDWSQVERPLLESTQSDVLVILDCCFAGAAHKHVDDSQQRQNPHGTGLSSTLPLGTDNKTSKHAAGPLEENNNSDVFQSPVTGTDIESAVLINTGRIFQLLAATGRDGSTPATGSRSLTDRLILSLYECFFEYRGPFSLRELIECINRKTKPPGQAAVVYDRLYSHHGRELSLGLLPTMESDMSAAQSVSDDPIPNSASTSSSSSVSHSNSNSKNTYPSTKDTSNVTGDIQPASLTQNSLVSMYLNEETGDSDDSHGLDRDDAETTYSIETTVEDDHLEYLQQLSRRLVDDVKKAGLLDLSRLPPGILTGLLKEFAQRLHGEASNPFQWETSIIIHRKQAYVVHNNICRAS